MKRFIYFLFVLIVVSSYLKSAPVVSYIIPDIGTPGMATYMEIISTTDGFGNYGNIDSCLNHPYQNPNIDIEFKNPNDTQKVQFTSIVQSWNGRMISTMVFVNPDLHVPNSEDWQKVTAENKIVFRLSKNNGMKSQWFTFYLVKPYNFGDLSNNTTDMVFGEGALGKRSPGGCMIVDNLKLNNITYKVSTNDCDPNTFGNQGYLPFIMLVKNDVIGKIADGKRTIISVDGEELNAGPGGGGGGGKFCDGGSAGYNAGTGSDGGKGFVGGGRGGANHSGNNSLSDKYKNWGESSGINNGSLNGVAVPASNGYENAGGGTGHPFGISGRATLNGVPTDKNSAGGYGGGSGGDQNTPGGGGGFSKVGVGSNGFNAGRIHGNVYGVPIGGGSGGASGNPQNIGTNQLLNGSCSGNGGGGGGAIKILCRDIENVIISANGGDGGIGDNNSDGGGGSGGYIGIFSKGCVSNVECSVKGGKTGRDSLSVNKGAGRVRIDAMHESGTKIIPPESEIPQATYRGYATDTTTYVSSKFTLKIKKDQTDSLIYFIRARNNNNDYIKQSFFEPCTDCSLNFDMDDLSSYFQDSILYFSFGEALWDIGGDENASGWRDSVNWSHRYDLSQSGYNILIKDKPSLFFGILVSGETKDSTLTIQNTSNEDLIINSAAITGIDKNLFTITNLNKFTFPIVVAPGGNINFNIIFDPTSSTDGMKSAYLELNTYQNGKNQGLNTLIRGEKRSRSLILSNNSIYFGSIVINKSKSDTIELTNKALVNIRIDSVKGFSGSNAFSINPNLEGYILSVDETGKWTISFRPKSVGKFSESIKIYFTVKCCTDSLIINLSGEGIPIDLEGKITITPTINFGLLAPCETKERLITFKNTGDKDITLNSVAITGNDKNLFKITNLNDFTFPKNIKPNEEITFVVVFSPNSSQDGVKKAQIVFNTIIENTQVGLITELQGENRAGLIQTQSSVKFDNVVVNTDSSITIELKNTGLHNIKITSVTGPFNTNVFSLTPDLSGYLLNIGEHVNLTVKFSPGEVKQYVDYIIVNYTVNGCADSFKIILTGKTKPEPDIINIILKLPKLLDQNPKVNILDIPIYSYIENAGADTKIEHLNIDADIAFNATLYTSSKINKGTLTNTIDPQTQIRTLKVKLSNITITGKEEVIAVIKGYSLLGNSDRTPLNILNPVLQSKDFIGNFKVINGELSYKICREGGDRLINYKTPLTMKINPNPVNDVIYVEITPLEKGIHTLELLNSIGEHVESFEFTAEGKDREVIRYTVPVNNYASGMYMFILKGPNRITTNNLRIIK